MSAFLATFLGASLLGAAGLHLEAEGKPARDYPSFAEAMGESAPVDGGEPLEALSARQLAKLRAAPTDPPATASPATELPPVEPPEADLRAETAPARAAPRATELLLPDLETLPLRDLSLIGQRSDGTLRLKFTNTIWNSGPGPLELRGAENPASGTLEVYQYAYRRSGVERLGRVGSFDYNHRHGHLHFDAFSQYRLWSLNPDGSLGDVVARNDKVGFCLMDIRLVDEALSGEQESGVYAGCRADIQGLSSGWGDEYLAALYEQDLEVSALPDGDYVLVSSVNPEGVVRESDYENNSARVYLRLQGDRLAAVWEDDGGT